MSGPHEFSAPNMALRTAAILFVFVVVFTALLSAAYLWTRPAIEASALAEKMKLFGEVLPATEYDNNLVNNTVVLPPTADLGLKEPSVAYLARKSGQPAALVFEAVAPDGYSGNIRLLIAVRSDGAVAGVRVTQHKETPGLGDYIDPKKDKNRNTPWITQFTGLTQATLPEKAWRVQKDGGQITYRAGATVTPRAVAKAVQKAVFWANANHDRLFSEEPQR